MIFEKYIHRKALYMYYYITIGCQLKPIAQNVQKYDG